MSGQIDLPAIGVKVVVDDSALARTGDAAGRTGKQIESGLGAGSKSTAELTSGLEGLAAQFGLSLPPQVKKSASALLSLATGSTTTRVNMSGLSQGVKLLGTDLGISLPPQAERTITALSGLSSTSAVTAAEVGGLSAGTKGLAADLGAGMPAQAEKSVAALKGVATSGLAANAAIGLTSGAVVLVEEDLAKTGNTASGAGEKIQSALETSQKASEALKSGLEGVGKGGEAAGAGGEAAASGLSSLTGAAVAGVAALTAVVVAGKSIEDSYVTIAEKVENFRRVTGASADDASREVQVFEELGVNAETASAAVYKLSKTVESTPGKLEALGIEIGKDNAGQVDLNKTLLNTADAYVRAGTALQKDTILQAAFGKSGREMIPILEQGAAGLKQLESMVQLTFTDQDLERVKQMKIHTAELKSEWQQYLDQLGAPITEASNNMQNALLAENYANQKYQQGLDNGTIKTELSGVALGKLLKKYEDEYYANQKAAEGMTHASQALQDQANHVQDLTNKLNAEITAIEGEASAEQKLLNANIDTKESQDKITESQVRARDANRQVTAAQAAYNQAVRDYGKNSEQAKAALDALTLAQIQARKAGDDITKAQEDQFQAFKRSAEAAQQLQIEQDKANDVTGLQAQKAETEKLIDTLQAEANALSPNSPLRARLQEYINMLKSQVPAEVSTKYLIEYEATFGLPRSVGEGPGGHGTQHFASGGRPPLGKISEVGEQGVEIFTPDEPDHPQLLIGTKGPQPFIPPEPGLITPAGQAPPDRGDEVRVQTRPATPASAQFAPVAKKSEHSIGNREGAVLPIAGDSNLSVRAGRMPDQAPNLAYDNRGENFTGEVAIAPPAAASALKNEATKQRAGAPPQLPTAPAQIGVQRPRQSETAPLAPVRPAPAAALTPHSARVLSLPVLAAAASASLPRAANPGAGNSVAIGTAFATVTRGRAEVPPIASAVTSKAAMPFSPSIPLATAPTSRAADGTAQVVAQLKELVGAMADRGSDAGPLMAHVTVDQPIVLDDQVIGRILDRRVAELLRAGGVS